MSTQEYEPQTAGIMSPATGFPLRRC